MSSAKSITAMGVGKFLLDTVLNVLSMKQEITSKEFSSLRTVKDTAEGFTKPFLQEYVVILCIVRPNPKDQNTLTIRINTFGVVSKTTVGGGGKVKLPAILSK